MGFKKGIIGSKKGTIMITQEKKKKVGFYCDPIKWENFKLVTKLNESDANKTLRILIDKYLKDNIDLVNKINSSI